MCGNFAMLNEIEIISQFTFLEWWERLVFFNIGSEIESMEEIEEWF